MGVSLDHKVTPCFILLLALRTLWATFQVENNARSTPLVLYLLEFHSKAIMRVPQIVNYAVVEKQMENKVRFNKAVMQALDLLQLAKKHTLGRSDIKQCKNQARSLSGY